MTDDRAKEGVEHLQSAALEVIAAVRAFLDVAEEVVRDPARAAGVVADLAALGRRFVEHAAPAAEPHDPGEPGEPRVTRVRVS